MFVMRMCHVCVVRVCACMHELRLCPDVSMCICVCLCACACACVSVCIHVGIVHHERITNNRLYIIKM